MKANKIELAGVRLPPRLPGQSAASKDHLLYLRGLDDVCSASADPQGRLIADWVRTYLMQPHPELGRVGHVCPFTSQAARLSLLRIGVSAHGSDDRAAILGTMQQALRAFDDMPCTRSTRVFRTVIVAFPHCADAAGIATLRSVQNAMRHHSIVRAKMIGLFEPASEAEGLLNREFRPLRSPLPVLAIRMLVEQDAPFVRRNPLLAPVYLVKFPFAGTRRLLQAVFPRGKNSSVGFWTRRNSASRRHGS